MTAHRAHAARRLNSRGLWQATAVCSCGWKALARSDRHAAVAAEAHERDNTEKAAAK